jgi:uncharacterized protein with FMN-binding domain
MKRALLIAGGTVGGLGAVLAITPPQLGSTSAINIAGAPIAGADTTASASASSSTSATPTAAATTAPAAPAAINGTFTGPSVNVNYGNVQVKITVVNGRITDAVAIKAPTGKNDRWTNMAVPILKQQTLKAQSANIQGVSGASYTSYGWFTSLQGAIALAGL